MKNKNQTWITQNELGNLFRLSKIAIGKKLKTLGLKDKKGATKLAFEKKLAIIDNFHGIKVTLWHKQKVFSLIIKEHKYTKEEMKLIYGYNENEINRVFCSLISISKEFEKYKNEINEYFKGEKNITEFNDNDFFNRVKNEACKDDFLELKAATHLGALMFCLYL